MQGVVITGVEKTSRNLLKHAKNIHKATQDGLYLAGEKAVSNLTKRYPDLLISGQYFPESLEYWVVVKSGLSGPALVICKATGKRVSTKTESEVGRKRGKEETPFGRGFFIETELTNISKDSAYQIEQLITEVLRNG
jgi:hypothetical protein